LALCSGTSLAAAHLSGILLWGDPEKKGYADYDRSAEIVGLKHKPQPGDTKDYEPTLRDAIGVKKP
jgi:hypothetical protein